MSWKRAGRSHRFSALLGVGALVLASWPGGPAIAQQVGGISSEIERTASTSPEEKLQYTDDALAEIGEIVANLDELLAEAQRSGDQKTVECVRIRRTSVRALEQVALTASDAMRAALGVAQREKADHEFRKIAVALVKSRVLYSEALRCGSDEVGADAATFIDVFNEDDIPLPTDDILDILGTDLPIDTLTTPTLSPFGG